MQRVFKTGLCTSRRRRRLLVWSSLLWLLWLPAVLLTWALTRDDFASRATIADEGSEHEAFVRAAQAFTCRMNDPEFLWQVASDAGLTTVRERPGARSWLRSHLPAGQKFFPPVEERQLVEDAETKAALAHYLSPRFNAVSDDARKLMTLTVQFDDPVTARDLTAAFTSRFVEREVSRETERLKSANQLAKPDAAAQNNKLTTRFTLLIKPTYDPVPVHRRKFQYAATVALLGFLFSVGVGSLLAQDKAARIAAGWPVVAEIAAMDLLFTRVTSQSYKGMDVWTPKPLWLRLAAPFCGSDHGHAHRIAGEALLRVMQGQVVLLVAAEDKGHTAEALKALIHAQAKAAPRPILFIDCFDLEPMATREAIGDFSTFLAGQMTWKQLRLPRTSDRAFDLIPARAGGTADARVYRRETLARLFGGLAAAYSRIYVRAHPSAGANINAVLAQEATDILMVADARSARASDITRAASTLDKRKLRGVVVFWT